MIVFENIDAPEGAKYYELTFKDGVTKRAETYVGTVEGQTYEVYAELEKAKEDLKRLSKREHNLFIERETLKKDNKELQEKYEALKRRLERLNERYIDLQKENEKLDAEVSLLKDLLRDTIRDLKEV